MNLRELCQAPGFDTAILTSFNFDPLFFERIVLRDLLASGCRQILVFADGVRKPQGNRQAVIDGTGR
ncbi:MAG: hypothetical protein JNK25_01560 [Phycisphaerae bacterium]|nr:hypothetical protein [Phycisphaerae bacterium]